MLSSIFATRKLPAIVAGFYLDHSPLWAVDQAMKLFIQEPVPSAVAPVEQSSPVVETTPSEPQPAVISDSIVDVRPVTKRPAKSDGTEDPFVLFGRSL